MSAGKKIRVAITGNIGSGKSTFTGFLKKLGYPVIFAYELSKEILQNDPIIRKQIISEFGAESFDGDQINSKYLADKVFSDSRKLKKINSILHPVVRKKIDLLSKEYFKKYNVVFVEAALIFESKIDKLYDYIILISADLRTRISRNLTTRKLSEVEFLKREKNQIAETEKMKKTDFIFRNDGSINDLEQKAHLLIKLLQLK